jgi:hypothetical protein
VSEEASPSPVHHAPQPQKPKKKAEAASRSSPSETSEDFGYEGGAGSNETAFDRAYALDQAREIIGDIRELNTRFQDGIGVSSRLYILSDAYSGLEDAGVPPGVKPQNYLPRLRTLASFAEQAADQYDFNAMEATAKFEVIKEQTRTLFSQINKATGSNLKVP